MLLREPTLLRPPVTAFVPVPLYLIVDLSVAVIGSITSSTQSNIPNAGIPYSLMVVSRATISLSVEECDTAVCFLHVKFKGMQLFGPTIQSTPPVLERLVPRSSANEASL